MNQLVNDTDSARKQSAKDYADQRRHAQPSMIDAGDLVLIQDPRPNNKLSPTYLAQPHTVVARQGDQLVLQSPDRTIRRNVVHTKPYYHAARKEEDLVERPLATPPPTVNNPQQEQLPEIPPEPQNHQDYSQQLQLALPLHCLKTQQSASPRRHLFLNQRLCQRDQYDMLLFPHAFVTLLCLFVDCSLFRFAVYLE